MLTCEYCYILKLAKCQVVFKKVCNKFQNSTIHLIAKGVRSSKSTALFRRFKGATFNTISNKNRRFSTLNDSNHKETHDADVLIVGGGAMGWSTAYWLKSMDPKLQISLVERDTAYERASTPRSIGGIRQQFSEPENIQMSLFGAQFIRTLSQTLAVENEDPPDINFTPHGYLVLATSAGVEQLQTNYQLQKSLGAKVMLLNRKTLEQYWPWMQFEDIELASYGYENEGWFDPWLLLLALQKKAMSLGVQKINAETVGFEQKQCSESTGLLTEAKIQFKNGAMSSVRFNRVVNAAGAWAGKVAAMAGIGAGGPGGTIPLPVEPRKRFVFTIHCRESLEGERPPPLLCDTSGSYLRSERQAGQYLCGCSPSTDSEEPPTNDLEVDHSWFESKVWPDLAFRAPILQSVKLRSSWAGFYDYNILDHNLILGPHPGVSNLYFINGSSGHGIQHALAAGMALAEFMTLGRFHTIDLTRLAFHRFINNSLVNEKNIF